MLLFVGLIRVAREWGGGSSSALMVRRLSYLSITSFVWALIYIHLLICGHYSKKNNNRYQATCVSVLVSQKRTRNLTMELSFERQRHFSVKKVIGM